MELQKAHPFYGAAQNAMLKAGRRIDHETALALLDGVMKRDRSQVDRCKALVDRARTGDIVRVRADYRYSTVGMAWAATTGAAPTVQPNALYSVGLGAADPVLGQMTELWTNVAQGGKQDAAELFICERHGFSILAIDISGATATLDGVVEAMTALYRATSSSLKTGTQTVQPFGPIRNQPGLNAGFQNGGTVPGATVLAATQGWQSLAKLNPVIKLNAGMAYSLALNTQFFFGPAAAPFAALPTGVQFDDVKLAIAHVFYGKTVTGISG